jgi:lipid A disaccharide synthetase
MPNLIAGRRIVPELIQHGFNAQAVVRELQAILSEGEHRHQMVVDLQRVRARLRDDFTADPPAVHAAREILGLLA